MFFHKSMVKKVYIGKLEKGDDIIESIEKFLNENKIKKAYINIIGAVEYATIGYYDQKKRVYVKKKFEKPMEILSIQGNISLKDDKIFPHLHAIFADKNLSAVGGHLFTPTKIFAAEFTVFELSGKILERKPDSETGLSLWH